MSTSVLMWKQPDPHTWPTVGERDRAQSGLHMMHSYGSSATETKDSPYELKFQDFTKEIV